MNENSQDSELRLREATIQEIQLELIRRTQFNAFDGNRVAAALRSNRHLWKAVMMDSIGISQPGRLPMGGLIKLRDLPENFWNVDTLYVLSQDRASAHQLAEMAEDWGGMVQIFERRDEVESALGGSGIPSVIVSIWWD